MSHAGQVSIAMNAAAVETASPILPILENLKNAPSRTWSIVITIFGDLIVPRGGSLWLGSLLGIFSGMGIAPGVVRTAMSRLANDEWLQRSRMGRNSFYKLTDKGRLSFAAAAEQIYGSPGLEWDGRFRLVLPATDRDLGRASLERAGFGVVPPGLWVAPLSTPLPMEARSLLSLTGSMDVETARTLASQAWRLDDISERYRGFIELFTPLSTWMIHKGSLSPIDSLIARILLIHEYRRIVLRDPMLPTALLPDLWPGAAARKLCQGIYVSLLAGSESWLQTYGQNENGPLPQSTLDLSRRFDAAAAHESLSLTR